MSTTSATPPATRRIAKSYLLDLIAATPGEITPPALVDHLLGHSTVRHVLRSDQLVLTFDLADDPASWSSSPAAQQGTAAGLDGQPASAD